MKQTEVGVILFGFLIAVMIIGSILVLVTAPLHPLGVRIA